MPAVKLHALSPRSFATEDVLSNLVDLYDFGQL